MTRTEIERTALPTLLDRLTDLAPDQSSDRSATREQSIRDYRISVQRDVEDLLNTRRTIRTVTTQHPELYVSVHQYGLSDTTGIGIRTAEGRRTLVESITDTLERFEPRLSQPVVRIVTEDSESLSGVRFTVEALLRMSPSPEVVVFDTFLEVASGAYEVRDSGTGAAPAPAPR
jgi:type VI secretion system protein ImpF